jgi:RNA polymerase sigma-B factor
MIGPIDSRIPAGWTRQELAELSDRELLGIVSSLPRFSQRRIAACELLVSRYRDLVRSCVRRYSHGPELTEDLMQVGYVGLVAAINNFDPAAGCTLASYAHPHITGEIKRYFRDKRWQIHIARPVKDLAMQVRTATWRLTQELGRIPAESDLAAYLGVSGHDLRNAQLAEIAFQPSSLDVPLSGLPGAAMVADLLGEEDPQMDHMLDMLAVATDWGELSPREQKILLMRFFDSMTQDQIGQQLGISQMQVVDALFVHLELCCLPSVPWSSCLRPLRPRCRGTMRPRGLPAGSRPGRVSGLNGSQS